MAEQTINCQIRTTEETKKRFATAAEESGITQGALLASMLDSLDVDKFGASHQSYAATLEAFDGKFRELRDLYKGLIITADNVIDAGVKSADEGRAVAEQKLNDALGKIEVMKLDLEHAELVEADRDRLKDTLAKTEDELVRRTARVDELEAERSAVKEAEAQAERDRAAAAEAETAKLNAEARAAAAEAELEKVKAAAENELATLKAKAEADSALAAEKLAAATARRDDLLPRSRTFAPSRPPTAKPSMSSAPSFRPRRLTSLLPVPPPRRSRVKSRLPSSSLWLSLSSKRLPRSRKAPLSRLKPPIFS